VENVRRESVFEIELNRGNGVFHHSRFPHSFSLPLFLFPLFPPFLVFCAVIRSSLSRSLDYGKKVKLEKENNPCGV